MTTRNLFSLKRTVFSLLFSLMILFSAVPIGARAEEPARLRLVAAVFPAYDFARVVAGDAAEVTLLLPPGADAHSYEPTPQDMIAIQNADLFLYTGGESDSWLERVLDSLGDDAPETFAMADCVTLLEEELSQSMAQEHGHAGHDHEEDGHEDGHEHEDEHEEMDEHVWTSMRNASVICDAIAETLEEMDPENKEIYQTNAENYKAKLSTLDQKYQETVDTDRQNTLIFADRFAFRYLVDDYGLNYYAAFSGCSAESEASFKTVTFLAGKLDELGIKTVLTIEKSDDRIAQTVIENTKKKDQKILELNSMQSITSDEIKNGVTYLSVMEDNLKVLKEALK